MAYFQRRVGRCESFIAYISDDYYLLSDRAAVRTLPVCHDHRL